MREATLSGKFQTRGAGIPDAAILIVEDHPMVAFGTAEVIRLRHPHYRTEIAGNAQDALTKLDARTWSWILLDLAVPGADGLSLVYAIHARGFAHRCCIVSAFATPGTVSEARHLGVAGYIEKHLSFEGFCEALDRVLRGHQVFPTEQGNGFTPCGLLTCRQVGVLRLIQRGMPAKRIALELGIAEGTVRNHTLAILRALGVNNRTHAVARGIECGLLGPPSVA